MSSKTEAPAPNKLDLLIWPVVVVALVLGVIGNFYFAEVAMSIRLAAWIVLAVVAGALALQTQHGRIFFNFTKDVRMELRKVVWPGRQQTIQTTGLVIVAVIVFALILWVIDSVLIMAVNWLTG